MDRQQHLLDIGQKDVTVHRAVVDKRCGHSGEEQRSGEGRCFPKCPCGTPARHRSPRSARPRRRAIFIERPIDGQSIHWIDCFSVSPSMKISFSGSRSIARPALADDELQQRFRNRFAVVLTSVPSLFIFTGDYRAAFVPAEHIRQIRKGSHRFFEREKYTVSQYMG